MQDKSINPLLNTEKFISIPIGKLKKAPWNFKGDDEEKQKKLTERIRKNGVIQNSVVRDLEDGTYEYVDGNHRHDSFLELGIQEVMCYDLGKVSIEEAKRQAIELQEAFEADPLKLSELLKELDLVFPDLDTTIPQDRIELQAILDSLDTSLNETVDTDIQETEVPKAPKTAISKRGDLFEFGEHRLLCGSSVVEEDVARLMDGKKAHLLFTDPPYNINYAEFNANRNDTAKDWTEEYCNEWKDQMSDEDYAAFVEGFLRLAKKNMIEHAHYYVWYATRYQQLMYDAFERAEIPTDEVPIIWNKNVAPLSWPRYLRKYEPCIFGGKKSTTAQGEGARWFGDKNKDVNIWDEDRDATQNYVHPTQKPVALSARALKNSSQKGEIVLEMFGGSGSTMLGCEQLGRRCFIMEYEPKFVDVILKRYMKYCRDNGKDITITRNGEAFDYGQLDKDIS